MNMIFHVLWLFLRSFISPWFYARIAHERSDEGLAYLFTLSLIFSFSALIVSLAIWLGVVGNFGGLSNLPLVISVLGITSLPFLKFIIWILFVILAAMLVAFIIYLSGHIMAVIGKFFNSILFAGLSDQSLIRIASFTYFPAAIVFYFIAAYLAYIDIIQDIATLPQVVSSYINSALPLKTVTIMSSVFVTALLPLPIWLAYILYAILCSKFYFPRVGYVKNRRGKKTEILTIRKGKRRKKKKRFNSAKPGKMNIFPRV